MTISKGSVLSVTASHNLASIGAFSSSQAGIIYEQPSNSLSGFLLDISGTTVTLAGAEASLYTAPGGFTVVFNTVCEVSSSNLRALIVRADVSPSRVAEIIPITKTATQLVGGSAFALTLPNDPNPTFFHSANNWSGDTLCMIDRISSNDRMITLANDSSQGNVVIYSPAGVLDPSIRPVFVPFDSSSGIMYYWNDSVNDLYGLPLTRSGLTITAGSEFQVNATDEAGSNDAIGACFVSDARQAAGHIDTSADVLIQTIDSPTTVNASTTLAATDTGMQMERFHSGSVCVIHGDASATRWSEFTVAAGGGLTHTNTISEGRKAGSLFLIPMVRLDNSRILSLEDDSTLGALVITTDVPDPAGQFSSGTLTARPVDIDADGSQLYISALNSSSRPVLIKFSTAINADGTLVFDPGTGSNIGVQCGRFDVDTVWIAGDFGGTDTVEKSENSGTSFTVKDPGTFGAVSAFAVGPDSDERVLIVDNGVDIQETINDGGEWIAKNTGLTPVTKSLARLDINVEEVVFGNESGANDNVDYSVNTGAGLEDLVLPVAVDVLGVIVN